MTTQEIVSNLTEKVTGADFMRDLALLLIVGTVCALAIMREQIPAEITTIASVIVGFYFRERIGNGKPKE